MPRGCQPMSQRIAAAIMLATLTACGGSSGDGGSSVDGDSMAGLDARPRNLSCEAPARTSVGIQIELEDAFPSLPGFQAPPLALLQAPHDDTRWYAAERSGTVRTFDNTPGVADFGTEFISIPVNTAGEGGLLGMAFDPDYAANGRVYLSWTEGDPMQSVVGRFVSINNGMTLDPAYEEIIRVDQDFGNHNGGQIAFGNDGYLYLGLGDGGSGNDPNERAQDTTNLLGAMLRLDVSGNGPGYAIPTDNPFVGNPLCPPDHSGATNCPEIYAWGLRNPWRWSFDRESGELWVGDVGQNSWEEVDRVGAGDNLGWNHWEGNHCYRRSDCSAEGMAMPVAEYSHRVGCSITGGYVYRGEAIAALYGDYIFGDFCSGRIWALDSEDDKASPRMLLLSGKRIASFAEDRAGELYLLDFAVGRIFRLTAE